MSDVLVDSSVWVEFFRGTSGIVKRLDPLIDEDRAAVSGAIVAEVASGARTLQVFHDVERRLRALNVLAEPADAWRRVADARFALARRGIQAHLVDLLIAATAHAHGHSLLTRDRDFVRISDVLPVDVLVC